MTLAIGQSYHININTVFGFLFVFLNSKSNEIFKVLLTQGAKVLMLENPSGKPLAHAMPHDELPMSLLLLIRGPPLSPKQIPMFFCLLALHMNVGIKKS